MRIRYMIRTLCLLFAPLALFGARVVQLPTLPSGELPNSEVVTNVALNVDYGRLENLTFSLELNASASWTRRILNGATTAGSGFAPIRKQAMWMSGRSRVRGESRVR